MIRSVRLDRLPDGLAFPGELAAKISFAPDAHELRFEGFMSKTDFDKLLRLSNDLAYQRALEQLFQKCTFRNAVPQAKAKHAPFNIAYAGIGAMALSAVLLVGWIVFGQSRSQTTNPSPPDVVRTTNAPTPTSGNPAASKINSVNHVAHQASDNSSQSFDGEIRPQ
jgi:hypothetical protein